MLSIAVCKVKYNLRKKGFYWTGRYTLMIYARKKTNKYS